MMLSGKQYSHDLFADEALAFVKRKHEKPFFLYLAFTIPHAKLQVPDLAPYQNAPWPNNLKTLAAMITRMDRDVGRLMAALRDAGIDENTLVIFASDNGAAYTDKQFNHSGPLRGHKRDMYEGGIRTPAVARWPGRIKAGRVSEQVWAFWDVLPTFADLTGQKPPKGLDGVSFLPALVDDKPVQHPPLYFEFHERGFSQAARMGDMKAVRTGLGKPLEVYDLKADPGETKNLAAQNPDLVKKFEEFLKQARVDSELWPIKAGKKP